MVEPPSCMHASRLRLLHTVLKGFHELEDVFFLRKWLREKNEPDKALGIDSLKSHVLSPSLDGDVCPTVKADDSFFKNPKKSGLLYALTFYTFLKSVVMDFLDLHKKFGKTLKPTVVSIKAVKLQDRKGRPRSMRLLVFKQDEPFRILTTQQEDAVKQKGCQTTETYV